MKRDRLRPTWAIVALVLLAGCGESSPEDVRVRGGGAGADGGNYEQKPIPVPSKITATKDLGLIGR